ncbi:hypothetical protein Avbf_17556 [Armadillidium vulgare]|nr:hypothetical protein Avbf_14308 [Armadillidium vulgare]RXG57626.1 hypothetical protein Avbf_17556 [Armadillidium vulgare]
MNFMQTRSTSYESKFPAVPTYMGERCNRVDLIGFVDASTDMTEVILYLKDLSEGKMNILSAKK